MLIKKLISYKTNNAIRYARNLITDAGKSFDCKQNSIFLKDTINETVAAKTAQHLNNPPGILQYKTKCLEALQGPNPREVVYVLEQNTGSCFTEAVGDASSCAVKLKTIQTLNKNASMVLLHGHPDISKEAGSLPVSLQDFLVLNNNKQLQKIIAYNSKGEQSFLRKKPEYKPLSEEQIKDLKNKYMKAFINESKPEQTDKIKELIDYSSKNHNSNAVKAEIAERLNKLQEEKSAKKIIDRFWSKNADRLNLIYYSDFS